MKDNFQREIDYLRISITSNCNLHCKYCIGSTKINKKNNKILSFNEIFAVSKIAVNDFGIKKIRLTGGEPLIRKGIVKLIKMLSSIDKLDDLSMTTNGILLSKYAKDLYYSGLNRVNISLDTVNETTFKHITGGGNIYNVFQGIDTALKIGLTPIKINCVIKETIEEFDAKEVKQYADKKGLSVRFIKQMDFKNGIFKKVYGGQSGECLICNRIRLLSDGRILPCLFSNTYYSIKKLGIKSALMQAIENKPKKGQPCNNESMINIGG